VLIRTPFEKRFWSVDLKAVVRCVVGIRPTVKIAKLRQQATRVDRSRPGSDRVVEWRIADLLAAARTNVTDVERDVIHQLALDEEVPLHRVG
jgi:hypothetical protein